MSDHKEMTLEEIKALPILEAKLLWHSDYYDGPLSGMCEVDGETVWFSLLHETSPIMCPKSEECEAQIIVEEEWSERTGTPIPEVTDEEWGCPPEPISCVMIYRYMGVYKVSPENMKEEERRHEVFRKYVGHHTDYNEDGERDIKTVHLEKSWPMYYEQAKKWPTLHLSLEENLIGYFIL